MKRVLIANRGEIALRILRACQEMGLETVTVFSTADAGVGYLHQADEAICVGGPPVSESYLNAANIIMAARMGGCDAIHPGYGFLAENHEFAQRVEEEGFDFIGPGWESIQQMGDKIAAKKVMAAFGLSPVPGSDDAVLGASDLAGRAEAIGYPILLKAAGGGGGRGMRVVQRAEELEEALAAAQAEAAAFFKDDRIYVEKFLARPRHVEFQMVADAHGEVVCHGSRDCTVQRRYQKLIEETPPPGIAAERLDEVAARCASALRELRYRGLGTVEFMYADEEFYFIEMNTRLQVEHPITEMTTGIDLVKEQLRIAMGAHLQPPVAPRGAAIECRINAEDGDFNPAPGRIADFRAPGGFGVRLDSHIGPGHEVDHYYDSLVAKLIAHGQDREEAVARMVRALGELEVTGIETNIRFHLEIMRSDAFRKADYGALTQMA